MHPPKGLLGLGLAMLMCVLTGFAQTNSTAARVRGYNNELLRLRRDLPGATPAEAAELRSTAAKVIKNRASALSDLIQENAATAVSFAFDQQLIADLGDKFPESSSHLESSGSWTGRIEKWMFDSPDRSYRSMTLMNLGGQMIEIAFKEGEEPDLSTGDELLADGVLVGRKLAVTRSTVISSAANCRAQSTAVPSLKTRSSAQATTTSQTCTSTGQQNVAVLLVTFPGAVLPPNITAANVSDMFFSAIGPSLSSYWREASYGQTSAAGNVFGPYVLDSAYADCSRLDLLRDAAITAAANAGVNFQNYSRIFIVHSSFNCGWTGLALNGCTLLNSPSGSFTASVSFLDANWQDSQVHGAQNAAHEGGHNMGLAHAQLRTFGTEALGPIGAAGTLTEYGDPFSDMSTSNIGHYAAPHKAQVLQWISDGPNYQTVQTSGTWTLQPFELSPAGLVALRVQRGTGNNAWLWIEYRQPIGIYDSTVWPPSGAMIHYEDSTTVAHTQLLDMSPGTTGAYDVALMPGNTWVDPYSNVSINVQSATANALTVSVTYGTTPCTHAAPTVSISPANPSISAGSSTNYTVSLTNNDSSGCTASALGITSSQPAGWTSSLSTSSVTLSPGQTGTLTMTDTAPAGTIPGTYAVAASAANGSLVGSANANCTIIDSLTTLSNTLALSGSSFTLRQAVSMTSTVTSGGKLIANASVTFTIDKPNGTTAVGKATTDATGKASWSYKLGQKDPVGSYSAVAQTTYNSQSATSNSVTFTVQ